MPDTTSRRVANWVLQEKIGRGSFAVVWKAVHADTGNCVAVKEISTDRLNKKLKQSLESEVSILKQIRHQNIVRLEDVVEVISPAFTFVRPTPLACLAACAFPTTSSLPPYHQKLNSRHCLYWLQHWVAGVQLLVFGHGVLCWWRLGWIHPPLQTSSRSHSVCCDEAAWCRAQGALVPPHGPRTHHCCCVVTAAGHKVVRLMYNTSPGLLLICVLSTRL